MRYFSLFSGIGGFEYGIKKANDTIAERIQQGEGQRSKRNTAIVKSLMGTQQFHCIGYSEINRYAEAIYRFHYPEQQNYGDATRIVPEELPDFDLLCAGFPCQTFSIAGKRKGFDDTRGTLFFEICRIAGAKRPDYLLLENVKGLLSHDEGRTFLVILQSLDELGYDLQWQVLNSKDWGVPQNRERVFIIGNLRGKSRPEVFPIRETAERNRKTGKAKSKNGIQISDSVTSGYSKMRGQGTLICETDKGQSYRFYNPEGTSPTLPTPSGGHHIPKIIIEAEGEKYKRKPKDGKIQGGDSSSISSRIYGKNGLSPNLMTQKRVVPKISEYSQIRRLTPIECERLQGFLDNWTKWGIFDGKKVVISDTQRYKCLGNAVTTNVITAIMERWKD